MKPLEKLIVKNPLDHCEARKAFYYAWVAIASAHPPGSNVSVAANNEYQAHKRKCEVCIEYEEGAT